MLFTANQNKLINAISDKCVLFSHILFTINRFVNVFPSAYRCHTLLRSFKLPISTLAQKSLQSAEQAVHFSTKRDSGLTLTLPTVAALRWLLKPKLIWWNLRGDRRMSWVQKRTRVEGTVVYLMSLYCCVCGICGDLCVKFVLTCVLDVWWTMLDVWWHRCCELCWMCGDLCVGCVVTYVLGVWWPMLDMCWMCDDLYVGGVVTYVACVVTCVLDLL